MESFAAIIDGSVSLTIAPRLSILDVCRDPGYTFADSVRVNAPIYFNTFHYSQSAEY